MIDIFDEMDMRESCRDMLLEGMTRSELLRRAAVIKGIVESPNNIIFKPRKRTVDVGKEECSDGIFGKESRKNRYVNWDADCFEDSNDPWFLIDEMIAKINLEKESRQSIIDAEKKKEENLKNKKIFESDEFYSSDKFENAGMKGYYGKTKDISKR